MAYRWGRNGRKLIFFSQKKTQQKSPQKTGNPKKSEIGKVVALHCFICDASTESIDSMCQAVRILGSLAARYCQKSCVTGIQACHFGRRMRRSKRSKEEEKQQEDSPPPGVAHLGKSMQKSKLRKRFKQRASHEWIFHVPCLEWRIIVFLDVFSSWYWKALKLKHAAVTQAWC